MKVSSDLTALIFELQRARSPADKAKALARAWRTLRGLSTAERRLLVREVGFDGAEDLVEGLAGKSGGVFAPAAVLEALGRMRKDESFTVRGILNDLRDPGRREDLVVRGLDLITNDADEDGGEELEPSQDTAVEDDEDRTETRPPLIPDPDIAEGEASDLVVEEPAVAAQPARPVAVMPPPPPAPRKAVRIDADDATAEVSEPVVRLEDHSTWDEQWAEGSTEVVAPDGGDRPPAAPDRREWAPSDAEAASVFARLQAFRRGLEELRGADANAVIDALAGLPEPWARRRAVVALLEAGVPASPGDALDLVESLDRPMDRGWCLSALARRGDLEGEDLERALEMLSSPAARRRVKALAGV